MNYKQLKHVLGLALLLAITSNARAQNATAGKQWVATWGTAQQLVRFPFTPGQFGGRAPGGSAGRDGTAPNATPSAPGSATGQSAAPPPASGSQPPASAPAPSTQAASGTPQAAPARRFGIPPFIAGINNQTIRMVLRTSIGGQVVRIRLANALEQATVSLGAAHIALRGSGSSIVPGSDRVLTFSGKSAATLYAGEVLISDPVNLNVPPLADIAVSLYVSNDAGVPTSHWFGLRPTYVSGPGDFTGADSIADVSTTTQSYYWLQGVDVLAPPDAGTIVTFGDSITDGDQSTPDTNHMWPAVLAERLQANPATRNLGVVNAGISGNRILGDNYSGLARLYHDALSVPGVKWITVLEGINDISLATHPRPPGATPAMPAASKDFGAEDLIAAYRQIIELAHLHGVRVIGCTITPFEGSSVFTERGEAIREAANAWIRTSGAFDAIVDFDVATRDPSNPHRFRPEADSPDLLHPSDSGYKLMGNAVDLSVFASATPARGKKSFRK